MSKLRFTDCLKWSDPWFMELQSEMKLLWLYLCDNCDNCGVWDVNYRLVEFVVGVRLDWAMALNLLEGRVVPFAGGKKWYLAKFLAFQYPSGLSDGKPHKQVIRLLLSHGLDPSSIPMNDKGREYLQTLSQRVTERVTDTFQDTDQIQTTPRSDSFSSGEIPQGEKSAAEKDQEFSEFLESLRLDGGPKSLGEFKILAKEIGCRNAEQTRCMISWSVKLARKDGKTVRFARHIEIEARRWKDANPQTTTIRKVSA